jgi:hypothetical protein
MYVIAVTCNQSAREKRKEKVKEAKGQKDNKEG